MLLPSISTSASHDGDIFVFSASFLSSFFFVRYVSKNPTPTSLVITIASLLSSSPSYFSYSRDIFDRF